MSTISIDIIFNAVNKAMPAINALDKGFSGINNNLWKVNQAAEAWNKTSQTITQISAPYRGFNEGLAELEAITGIAGDELKQLGKTARKTGKDSGLGATGAIEAYKLLASQIDVSKIGMEGLNGLHKDTITLAQTSKKLGLEGSANAIAGTLNQFGYAADQSGRVMNVLAAGSKYGAAEVYELAASFKVAGASIASAGLDVEQGGGAIETLSKMNLKGAEAGTAMRNILLKMQTELGFDFKVTKLSDALATLAGKEGDAAFMAKTFGAENMAAAQFLIKNSAMVEEMTGRMTDTNVATEQANINNRTFNHWLDVKRAKMNDLSIAFFQHNEGLLKGVMATGQMATGITTMLPLVGGLGKGLTGTIKTIGSVGKAGKLMSAALAAGKLGTYSDLIKRYGAAGKIAGAGMKIGSAAQKAWGVVNTFATGTMVPLIASTWAWTAALLGNPITWIVVGVAALIAGLALAWKHFDGFRGAVVGAWEGIKQFGVILWQSIINPIKQILSGLGAIGKAIGLAFKGKFGEAAAAAKEGFADVVEGAVKATPAGIALEVVSRRKEIVDKAEAGYEKGKAIDTGVKKKGDRKRETGEGVPGQAAMNFSANMPKQGLGGGKPLIPPMSGTLEATPKVSAVTSMNIPGTINAAQPTMKVVKAPGMVDPLAIKQPAAVTVPGQISAAAPSVPGVNIPGTINAAQPTMKVVKAPGMVDPLAVKQPAAVSVPGKMAMNQPSVSPLNIPGTISAAGPALPGMNIPATIDAQQPTARPMTIPGIVSITTPKIEALNVASPGPSKGGETQQTKWLPNLEALSNNITNNISKSEIKNQTDNKTKNESSEKINVTYSPTINISSAMDQRAQDDLMKMLADNKDELMKLINEEMRRNNRLRYAG